MKNNLLLILALVPVMAFAQKTQKPDKPARERVESMKIGFLTSQLELTPEEAQAFWPVYNKYSEELETLRKNRRESMAEARKGIDELTDKELEKMVDSELAFRQAELDVLKKYHPQFKQVLPLKKVAKLYRAEEEFKRKLLEMLQERRENKRPR